MVTLKNKVIAAYNKGEISIKEVAQQLIEQYPSTVLAETLAELLLLGDKPVASTTIKRIPVTKEEFDKITDMFRIKGVDAGGSPSKRGRKPKNKEV